MGLKMPSFGFPTFVITARNGWEDVTESLETEGAPVTLARSDGVGALQFSIARYRSGVRPDPMPEQLLKMVREFGKAKGLGTPASVETEAGRLRLAAASFVAEGDFVRVWYASDGWSVALVTYVCEAGSEGEELAECEEIVRSLDFSCPR
jgi:hypothetical protein